jgi:hypothetical protein
MLNNEESNNQQEKQSRVDYFACILWKIGEGLERREVSVSVRIDCF